MEQLEHLEELLAEFNQVNLFHRQITKEFIRCEPSRLQDQYHAWLMAAEQRWLDLYDDIAVICDSLKRQWGYNRARRMYTMIDVVRLQK